MAGLRKRGWQHRSHGVYHHPNGGECHLDRFRDGAVFYKLLGEGIWPLTTSVNQLPRIPHLGLGEADLIETADRLQLYDYPQALRKVIELESLLAQSHHSGGAISQ